MTTGPVGREPTPGLLRQHLSPERLGPYERAAGGLQAGLRLYQWNCATSSALHESLGLFEVLLRNALDTQLHRWRGGPAAGWLLDPPAALQPRAVGDIADARQRVVRERKPLTHGRVLAEINFGFWRFLLAAGYEKTLWTPALRHAFPHLRPQRRRTVYELVDHLHQLRNRVAHHEPVHHLPLATRYQELLTVVGYIEPRLVPWVGSASRVPALLAARPSAGR